MADEMTGVPPSPDNVPPPAGAGVPSDGQRGPATSSRTIRQLSTRQRRLLMSSFCLMHGGGETRPRLTRLRPRSPKKMQLHHPGG